MTSSLCPTCRVVRDFLDVLTAADAEPARLGTVRKLPEIIAPAPTATPTESPPIYSMHVQKLVLLRRSYEEEPASDETTIGGKQAAHDERTEGIVDGLQMAIDLLARELGVKVDDPAAVKRRGKASTLVEVPTIRIAPSPYALGLLRAVKQLVGIRIEGVASDESIALVAGRSITSSTFDTAIGELLEDGLLDGGPKARFLTAKGSEIAGHVAPIKRGDDLVAFWSSKLEPIESAILAACVKQSRAKAGQLSREEIASAAHRSDGRVGYSATSSSTDGAFTRLRKLGLIQEGSYRCAEELR